MALLPLLICLDNGPKILFSETNLQDYPALFLKKGTEEDLCSVFPPLPLEFEEEGDRSLKIVREAPYIARTTDKRNYP